MNKVGKGAGLWTVLMACVLSGLFFSGCKSHSPKTNVNASAGPLEASDSADRIRAGDTLQITITDVPVPQAASEDKVLDDGTITLLLNQTFTVTNKTTGEIAREIRARYVPDFFKNMTVNVVHMGQTRFYYVGGEVKAPGRQVYTGPITVTKAIQTCGDWTDFSKKTNVKLTRVNGRVETINCKKALLDPRLDLEVYPGDKITVARRVWM